MKFVKFADTVINLDNVTNIYRMPITPFNKEIQVYFEYNFVYDGVVNATVFKGAEAEFVWDWVCDYLPMTVATNKFQKETPA